MALKYLAEYPTGSPHYYGAPAETDAMGWAYRKDWFEDPAEKDAFKKRFKKDLAVPETWEELETIAEFFTRPDKKRYGDVLVTGRGYDDIVMGFEQLLYAFGGSWGDAKTLKVKGALDSPDAVKALDFFKGLLKYSPPGGSKLGYGEALEPFVNNSTAMLMNYFAFFPDLAKKMSGKVGFFAMPKEGDRRFSSLGGQGFSISSKVPTSQQDLAKSSSLGFCKSTPRNSGCESPVDSRQTPRSSRATNSRKRARTTPHLRSRWTSRKTSGTCRFITSSSPRPRSSSAKLSTARSPRRTRSPRWRSSTKNPPASDAVEAADEPQRGPRRVGAAQSNRMGRAFVAPALLLLLAINLFPLIFNVYLSFTNADLSGGAVTMVGAHNYTVLFSEARYANALTLTAWFVLVSVSVELVLGFVLALALQGPIPGKPVVLTLLLIPMMLCPVVLSLFGI